MILLITDSLLGSRSCRIANQTYKSAILRLRYAIAIALAHAVRINSTRV